MPTFADPVDACADACAPARVVIPPGATVRFPLALKLQLPLGWECQVRGRSGLALGGLEVHPGTVDHLYREEVAVILHNLGHESRVFEPGDRICQLAVRPVPSVIFKMGTVHPTSRSGFGSTGTQPLPGQERLVPREPSDLPGQGLLEFDLNVAAAVDFVCHPPEDAQARVRSSRPGDHSDPSWDSGGFHQ